MWPFKKKPVDTRVWKYVGQVRSTWSKPPAKGTTGWSSVVYFMTDEGDRRWDLMSEGVSEETVRAKSSDIINAEIWKAGGPFPPDFAAETDTLGAMLNRLVNEKLGFTDEGKDGK